MDLQASIAVLKGLGPKSAEKFHKLDIYTIEDLLLYYPFRYEDFKTKSVLTWWMVKRQLSLELS